MTNDAARAQRQWWDSDAERYHAEHGPYLSSFYWSPEMIHEADARLLGDVSDKSVLELGCGSAPCSSWLAAGRAGFVTGFDISAEMLARAEGALHLVQADVQALPYRDGAFDVVFSAFGGLPFVPDAEAVFRDVARVLADAGRLVFSVNHPMRWIFPDDPGAAGLGAAIPYFENHYAEYDEDGTLTYIEYHRTVGDWIRALVGAGFRVLDVIEPEWPAELTEPWGQWSPLRGRIFPGTAIFVAQLG
ncbi:class I SAM-dependent DNA methyltransferase [Corynebacterium guangdongense]|uniref:SAM-dependent methyltransferase n=1 Tax=Corynebacterium guangdongense TaxID=1783348 RepID=A0ABU1ZXX7_9CORY|nr:class I SAM-dependent methyltransferase [Corynebacterium guangdongense]MDR7329233.1 SAM-dependent methyltransferase [Corynebacterium guangdongense]WJZ17799.1 ubiquinone/menaquinone biosynthesis methyltransferase [Corynebacterium guangdongense]